MAIINIGHTLRGIDGERGVPGFSPSIDVVSFDGGVKLYINNESYTDEVEINHGVSPEVVATRVDDHIVLEFITAYGTSTEFLYDGPPGMPGKDNLPNVVDVDGSTVSLTMDNNVEYHCKDAVSSLSIEGFTPATDGKSSIWTVQFKAGETITVSLPDTVKWSVAQPVFAPGVSYWLNFVPLLDGILGVWVSDE